MTGSAIRATSDSNRPRVKPTGVELRDVHTPELVFALCGPIGSPLHEVASKLKDLLEQAYGYECAAPIRLSKFIDELCPPPPSPTTPYARVSALINRGNDLRDKYGASILADLAVRQIAADRESHKSQNQAANYGPRRICHTIDSIKNTEELETLRLVYGDLLFTIAPGVWKVIALRQVSSPWIWHAGWVS